MRWDIVSADWLKKTRISAAEREKFMSDLNRVIQAIVDDLIDLNMGILITVDKNKTVSMCAATRDGLASHVENAMLYRISSVLFPNVWSSANKLPI